MYLLNIGLRCIIKVTFGSTIPAQCFIFVIILFVCLLKNDQEPVYTSIEIVSEYKMTF